MNIAFSVTEAGSDLFNTGFYALRQTLERMEFHRYTARTG